jgi:hypothetical protein
MIDLKNGICQLFFKVSQSPKKCYKICIQLAFKHFAHTFRDKFSAGYLKTKINDNLCGQYLKKTRGKPQINVRWSVNGLQMLQSARKKFLIDFGFFVGENNCKF